MRPLPETNPYKPEPHMHPRRPWWDKSFVSGCSRFVGRSRWSVDWEGRITIDTEEGNRTVSPDVSNPRDVDSILAWVDRTHPIPAPRLCPGQVWLLQGSASARSGQGEGTLISLNAAYGGTDAQKALTVRLMARDLSGVPFPSTAHLAWEIGGSFYTPEEAKQLLFQGIPNLSAFLLFDPLDPRGRPWSGSCE